MTPKQLQRDWARLETAAGGIAFAWEMQLLATAGARAGGPRRLVPAVAGTGRVWSRGHGGTRGASSRPCRTRTRGRCPRRWRRSSRSSAGPLLPCSPARRLVATGFGGYEVQAAVLDLPDGAEWAPIDPPPEPDHQLCRIELHRGEAGTVYMTSCSGEMAVLDGGGWRSLPPAPIDAVGGEILVTADELLVQTRDGSALARLRLP